MSMDQPHSNLVLGTAQLGLPYGIANKTGQPDQAMATTIVCVAWENGIREFDTAQGYGVSEQVLGKALSELVLTEEARVISKFDPDLDHLDRVAMSKALDETLYELGVPYLFGMMLHREELLPLWGSGLGKILHDFVSSGRVKHVGISVYSPDRAIQALNTEGVDMVQLPTNILDRRFEEAGVFQLAEKKGKKTYIRSVFLQGLILLAPDEIPEKMSYARPVLEKLELLSKETGLTRQEIALGASKMALPNARVIFGADTPGQVKENVKSWGKEYLPSLLSLIRKTFKDVDERILNPTCWPN